MNDNFGKLISLAFQAASVVAGCNGRSGTVIYTSLPEVVIIPPSQTPKVTPTMDIADYAFPAMNDPDRQYIFYIHGRIVEE